MDEGIYIALGTVANITLFWWLASRDDRKRFRKCFFDFRAYYLRKELPGVEIDSLEGRYYAQWHEGGTLHLAFFEGLSGRREMIANLSLRGIVAESGVCDLDYLPFIARKSRKK